LLSIDKLTLMLIKSIRWNKVFLDW